MMQSIYRDVPLDSLHRRWKSGSAIFQMVGRENGAHFHLHNTISGLAGSTKSQSETFVWTQLYSLDQFHSIPGDIFGGRAAQTANNGGTNSIRMLMSYFLERLAEIKSTTAIISVSEKSVWYLDLCAPIARSAVESARFYFDIVGWYDVVFISRYHQRWSSRLCWTVFYIFIYFFFLVGPIIDRLEGRAGHLFPRLMCTKVRQLDEWEKGGR